MGLDPGVWNEVVQVMLILYLSSG